MLGRRQTPKHASSETPRCVYCRGDASTKDHAPPKCLLQKPLPSNLITFDACLKCNSGFSFDESVVTAVLALVSPHPGLIASRQPGGRVYRAIERDRKLHGILEHSRQKSGNYALTEDVLTSFERVFFKTVQGLFFGLYGKVVKSERLALVAIENCSIIAAEDVANRYRPPPMEDITDMPVSAITPSSWHVREPIFIVDLKPLPGSASPIKRILRLKRDTPIDWFPLQPGIFRFAFVKSKGENSVCIMELWKTLVVAVKAPWPGNRGALRRGRKNPHSRD